MAMVRILSILCAGTLLLTQVCLAEEDLFDTKTAAAYFEEGMEHLKARKYDAAIEALEESVTIYPHAEGFYYLGYTYYIKGRMGDSESRKKSIECFEKAYELDPRFSPNRVSSVEVSTDQPQQKTEPVEEEQDMASSSNEEPEPSGDRQGQ